MAPNVFLTRVVLSNYRSIASADVRLGPLTYLVGRNGAGKSNFLDALRLVSDALNGSLEQALRDRGGIHGVVRRSDDSNKHLGIRLEMQLAEGCTARYAFKLSAARDGGFEVEREECAIIYGPAGSSYFAVERGKVQDDGRTMPPASSDRLYLVNAAGLPAFRPVFDALSRMGIYNIHPEVVRQPQVPDRGDFLKRDGENLSSVLAQLERPELVERKQRVMDFLAQVVPGLEGVQRIAIAHLETLEFSQRLDGQARPIQLLALNMSDGTLRVLGVLVALFQPGLDGRLSLVGLEEPETALHPAAASVLRDCITAASQHVQVLVTSHSGDLLDDPNISEDMVRAVEVAHGSTQITSLDPASRSALRDHLYSAGELLRANQLGIDPEEAARTPSGDEKLFEAMAE